MEYILNNWMEIAGIAALAILIGERVALLTPTKSDDKVVQFVRKIALAVGLKFPDIQKIDDK